MTPDTLSYFIAGYIVIFIGITGYILSIVIRFSKLKRMLKQKSAHVKDWE